MIEERLGLQRWGVEALGRVYYREWVGRSELAIHRGEEN